MVSARGVTNPTLAKMRYWRAAPGSAASTGSAARRMKHATAAALGQLEKLLSFIAQAFAKLPRIRCAPGLLSVAELAPSVHR
jgi:hypothetical protein